MRGYYPNHTLVSFKIKKNPDDIGKKLLLHQHHLLSLNKRTCLESVEVNSAW